jgi:hypothetical protein
MRDFPRMNTVIQRDSSMRGNGREKFIIQSHICSIWKNGQYKRSRNIDEVACQ